MVVVLTSFRSFSFVAHRRAIDALGGKASFCSSRRFLATSLPRRMVETAGVDADLTQLSAKSINRLAPLYLFHRKLREETRHHVLSNQSFENLASECGVSDPSAARSALAEAGYIIDFGEYVHLRPALLLSQCDGVLGAVGVERQHQGKAWSVASGDEDELRALVMKEQTEREVGLGEPLRRLYKRQRLVWGLALLFCGFQACVIANLTFTEDGLGWDVMEPVSYFVGCYTSLLFFVFMLRYKKEHSYIEFDKSVVIPKLRSKFAKNFDWRSYDALCASVKKKSAIVEKKRAWMNNN